MQEISKIIEELADNSTSLNSILLKTKILAHRLDDRVMKEWIENEINGYQSTTLPEYRKLPCNLVGSATNGHWQHEKTAIPIQHLSKEMQNDITIFGMPQGVAVLQSLSNAEHSITNRIPPEILAFISQGLDNGFYFTSGYRQISAASVQGILATIRSKLLDFMLELETTLGSIEGTPSSEVKAEISEKFVTAIYGSNGTNINVIMQGDGNNNIVAYSVSKGDFESLEKVLKQEGVTFEDVKELKEAVQEDGTMTNGKTGPKVNEWLAKAYHKTLEKAGPVAIDIATRVITNAVSGYYGLTPK